MIPTLCIIFGSLVTIIAAIYNYKEQLDAEIKRNGEYQNLLSKSNSIITTQQSVIDSSNRIIELQNQLSEKNDKIQDLQNNTLNIVTGGENVPKLVFIASNKGIVGKVINDGKFPVRTLSIEFEQITFDYFIPDGPGSSRADSPDARKFNSYIIGDLPVNAEKHLMNEFFPKQLNDILYIYTVNWLNGHYRGGFKIKTDNNGKIEIVDNNLSIYKKGLKLYNAVKIDDTYASVIPFEK